MERSWKAPHTGGPTGTSSFLPTASDDVMPPLPVCDKVSSGACSCDALKQYWPVAVLYPGSSIDGSAIVWPPARRAARVVGIAPLSRGLRRSRSSRLAAAWVPAPSRVCSTSPTVTQGTYLPTRRRSHSLPKRQCIPKQASIGTHPPTQLRFFSEKGPPTHLLKSGFEVPQTPYSARSRNPAEAGL